MFAKKKFWQKVFFLTKIYFAQKEILPPKNFANKKFVNKKIFFTENKIVEKNLPRKNFVTKIYCQKKIQLNFFFFKFYFLAQRAKIFGINVFLGQKFFRKRILRINFFGTKLCFLAQPLLRPSSRLTVSAWVSPSSTPACSFLEI